VHLSAYAHQKKERRVLYELRGAIHLPTGALAAHAENHDPIAALDEIIPELVAELKKHRELVRKDFLFKRKNRRREELSAAGPQLQRNRSANEQADFFQRLRPMLGFLREHARRELRVLEIEGKLHRGEVAVDDVIDEVELRAWQQFDQRPQKLPLDLWLIQLLHQVLEEWIKQEPRQHAELSEPAEERRPEDVPQVDDQEWWQWLLDDYDDQPPTLEETLPDRSQAPVDEDVSDAELRERALAALGELPERQRQAFLLKVLDDYDSAEIAMLQDRSESEVRADLESARRMLREKLQGADKLSARE
jgi:RNA polymerase sigma factor (sigma-70 family)